MSRRSVTHSEGWWTTAPPSVTRCNGTYKSTGLPCRRESVPGGAVCREHGGLAPQVIAAAQTRVAMTADRAAEFLVGWMADPGVDMRERVKIAQDMLDRSGLSGVNKLVVGIGQIDPVESLFQSLLSDPSMLTQTAATPPELAPEWQALNQSVLEEQGELDIVDAEVVEEPSSRPRLPAPGRTGRNPAVPPRHIREALEALL